MSIDKAKIAEFKETAILMENAVREACLQFGVPLPNMRFSNKMTSAAGRATKTTLSFSIPLLLRTDRDECIETAVHEAAHYIDFHQRGTSDHGEKWRNVMAQLGYPNPPRCHQIDRSDLVRFFLECGECKKQLRTYTRRPSIDIRHYRSNCCHARLVMLEVKRSS